MQGNLGKHFCRARERNRNNGRRIRMTDASAYNAIPRAIRSLYEPQLEQFGIIVRRNGEGWSGTGRSTWGRGSIWGMPVGDFCIAFSHEVYMEHDMTLVESPESAYACVCMVSEDSKATMPRMIDRPRALLDGSLYSFVQSAGSFSGTLHRGGLYSSRCICFLPQYFEELDRRWPGAFSGMFERFGGTWDEAQSRIIMSALLETGPQYRPGSALLIQARIEQMVAALAASCAGDDAARCGASTRERSVRACPRGASRHRAHARRGARARPGRTCEHAVREPVSPMRGVLARDGAKRWAIRQSTPNRARENPARKRKFDRICGCAARLAATFGVLASVQASNRDLPNRMA